MNERVPATRKRATVEVLLDLTQHTYGYFLSRDASREGIAASTLSDLRARGVIESTGHGINRIVSIQDTWEGRALAALWSCGPQAALGRWAALRVHEAKSTPTAIDVVLPRTVRKRAGTTSPRSHLRITPSDVVRRGRFPVTSPAFTTCDLAAIVSTSTIVEVADRLIAAGLLDLTDLRVMTGRFWAIDGVQRLRDALLHLDPSSRGTRSNGERLFRRLIAELGLPPLVANHRVVDADGATRYLDFCWPELRIAFEVDLHPNHYRTIGRNADGQRQNALVLAGWTILRFDRTDLMTRPDHVAAEVLAAYQRATA